MNALIKSQVPNPPTLQRPSNWAGIGTVIGQIQTYLNALALYLQTYLGRIYQVLVPLQYPVMVVTNAESPYVLGATDVFLAAAAGASTVTTIDLPVAAGTGRVVVVTKTDSNAHDIIILPSGSDTINGATSYSLTSQYASVSLIDAIVGEWLSFQ
jgi:hypothetical protein